MFSGISNLIKFVNWKNHNSSPTLKEIKDEVKNIRTCSMSMEARVEESAQYIDRILDDDLTKIIA